MTALAGLVVFLQLGAAQPCPDTHGQPRVVWGVVRDELTGRPAPGAQVHALPASRGAQTKTSADSRAVFRFCADAGTFPLLLYSTVGERVGYATVVEAAVDSAFATLVISAAAPARVSGRVVESGDMRGVAGLAVRLGQHFTRMTDRNGRFEFEKVPPGQFLLAAEAAGFNRGSADTLRVAPGASLDVVIPVASDPVALAPVVVTVRSKGLEQVGFYDRQRVGQGSFLTRVEIDRMRGVAVPSDLLRGFNGVRLARRPNGRGYRVVGRNQCPYRYYVDGVRIGQGFEFDDLEWHWIDAVEVYNGIGQVPARFADADPANVRSCGVVVVWTRQVAR